MKTSEQLFQKGITFRKGNEVFPFPVDDDNPSLSAADYFLDRQVIGQVFLAWKQWRAFVSTVLAAPGGVEFVRQFFSDRTEKSTSDAPEADGWSTRGRSELDWWSKGEKYFFGPHITRIDLGINKNKRPVIIDPNVMPYGIAPMVATQQILGLNTQVEYLKALELFNPTWVVDRAHGAASQLEWLMNEVGGSFTFSDDFSGADNVVRLSRREIRGSSATVGTPGIRIFESQLWNALLSIPGLAKSFGFNVDLALHRINCAPCFLVHLTNGSLKVAFTFEEGKLQWLKFDDFAATQWAVSREKIFLKCLATSGCRQVTFSDFRSGPAIKAICSKLTTTGEGYFLLQPGLPCLVDGERVRVASYLGPKGEHYGSEVTRVPANNMLSHGGSHAKMSYLAF